MAGQLGSHRYLLGNWWNWCKNERAEGEKYIHRRNFLTRVKIFTWPHVTAWSEGYVTLLLNMWLLIICHLLSSLIATGHVKKNLIAFLICYTTLCDHVINRLCDFVDNRPALEPTTLSSLVVIGLGEVEIYRFLFITWLHVATWLQGHVTLLVVVTQLVEVLRKWRFDLF